MSNPTLAGVRLATTADLDSLRDEIGDLRRQIIELARRAPASGPSVLVPLQEGFATLTPEEQASFAASEREARAFFERGCQDES
jgi:hypothetical protein